MHYSRVKTDGDAAEGPSGPHSGQLWPTPDYAVQVERLRSAIRHPVYLVELVPTEINLGVHYTDKPYVLLDVLDFPRPDPAKGLAPHMLLLDDGRGVNLGRIARVSTASPFNPTPAQILYTDREALQRLLFVERRLSQQFIAARSRALLGQLLAKVPAAASLATR